MLNQSSYAMLELGTATLYEADETVQTIGPPIMPLFRPIDVCGAAFPVLAAPGDNLAVHRALATAPAGAVLVVATGGELRRGFWGEIMTAAAQHRGIAGLVTDGAVRDIRAIQARAFPVFCAAVAIPGTSKRWPGLVDQPVVLGQAMVQPGDLVVGDDDGVIIIPGDSIERVLTRARERQNKEQKILQQLADGALTVDLLDLRRHLPVGDGT